MALLPRETFFRTTQKRPINTDGLIFHAPYWYFLLPYIEFQHNIKFSHIKFQDLYDGRNRKRPRSCWSTRRGPDTATIERKWANLRIRGNNFTLCDSDHFFFRNTKTTSSKISPKSKIEKFLTTVLSSAFLEKSEFAFRAAFRQFRSLFRNSTANSTALKRRWWKVDSCTTQSILNFPIIDR